MQLSDLLGNKKESIPINPPNYSKRVMRENAPSSFLDFGYYSLYLPSFTSLLLVKFERLISVSPIGEKVGAGAVVTMANWGEDSLLLSLKADRQTSVSPDTMKVGSGETVIAGSRISPGGTIGVLVLLNERFVSASECGKR